LTNNFLSRVYGIGNYLMVPMVGTALVIQSTATAQIAPRKRSHSTSGGFVNLWLGALSLRQGRVPDQQEPTASSRRSGISGILPALSTGQHGGGTLTLAPIDLAITVSLPAVPPTSYLVRPLPATMSSPAQPIVTATYSAPPVLLGSSVELHWTDTVSETATIRRAIGPCGNPRARFVNVAVVPTGNSYTDSAIPGNTYCYDVNGSRQTAVVPTITGTPVPPTPPIPR
jgi:hypothetical protein